MLAELVQGKPTGVVIAAESEGVGSRVMPTTTGELKAGPGWPAGCSCTDRANCPR